MSDERFAARVQDERRRRFRRIAIAVLVSLLVVVLVWVIWFSRILAVRSVAVDGETSLSESQIRSAAQIPSGRPLARVDLAASEDRIAALERVEDVKVARSWPHTVRITIVERKAIAWISDGGVIRGLDRFGVDFRTYSKEPKGLVEAKVTVTDARKRQQTLEAVAHVLDEIDKRDPAARKLVQGISAGSKDSIELNLTKGRIVTWGSGGNAARKLEVLKPLLRIRASTYDVSAPDQPTTKK